MTFTVNIVESGDAPGVDLAQGLVAHRQLELTANFPTSVCMYINHRILIMIKHLDLRSRWSIRSQSCISPAWPVLEALRLLRVLHFLHVLPQSLGIGGRQAPHLRRGCVKCWMLDWMIIAHWVIGYPNVCYLLMSHTCSSLDNSLPQQAWGSP